MTEKPRPAFSQPVVLLLAGSTSDLDLVLDCRETLDALGIPNTIRIVSAHRTPEAAAECASGAEKDGFQVLMLIAFAGLAAQLAGMAAAHSRLPVIGVPRAVGPLQGVDAVLASLQMPPGTPVAVVAINGARNAALLAARILGVAQPELRERLSQLAERERARYASDKVEAEIKERERARHGKPK
jgi:5-(carboxyamino)imidazole ribonucleotide mutase